MAVTLSHAENSAINMVFNLKVLGYYLGMSERRGHERCPICQGPALEAQGFKDNVRCRRSTCIQNHSDICPRCNQHDLESVTFEKGEYTMTCRECLNTWKKPD